MYFDNIDVSNLLKIMFSIKNKMNYYRDAFGIENTFEKYDESSFRGRVANIALKTRRFFWLYYIKDDEVRVMPMFRCCQCESPITFNGMHANHIQARSHGGSDNLSNLQILCSTCNYADMHHRDGVPLNGRTRYSFKRRRTGFSAKADYTYPDDFRMMNMDSSVFSMGRK